MENLGNIIISENVIKEIVIETIKNIDEVHGVCRENSKTDIKNFFKSNEKKCLEVEMGETECVIELSLSLEYGCKIQEVSKKVQELVSNKVEELTGIKVREVNVTVVKIEKKEEVVENV